MLERVSVILTRLHFLTSTLHHSLASDSKNLPCCFYFESLPPAPLSVV